MTPWGRPDAITGGTISRRDDADRTRTGERAWPVAPTLITYPPAAAWRRRLGPLAWVALEHLALSAHHTDEGWVAPIGVRDIAAGIGVTKDTAARAVANLGAAGLASLTRVQSAPGRRRSGYRLRVPEPMRLIERPIRPDDLPDTPAGCPEGEYKDPVGRGTDRPPDQDNNPREGSRRACGEGVEGLETGLSEGLTCTHIAQDLAERRPICRPVRADHEGQVP